VTEIIKNVRKFYPLFSSYRKKNEYVYVDRPDDDTSLYHQSLSRHSSLRDLNNDSLRRQDSLQRQNSGQNYRDHRDRNRSSSLNRYTDNYMVIFFMITISTSLTVSY
jgi:hypothetical protein